MGERGIKVICRFRPQNKIEDEKGGMCCVEFLSETTCKVAEHSFTFDRVFGGASQMDIYEQVRPVVPDLLDGYNATIFAYGQTSSGKTFTMQGPSIDDAELKGIIPRVIEDIFASVAKAPEHVEFTIRASYLEIYLEKIRDLLDTTRDNLKVREERTKGIYVEGQTEVYVGNTAEVYEVLRVGQHNRAIAATGMNAQSSRSHSVFLLGVQARNTKDQTTRAGRLYLVDLAGSEKVGKTGAAGVTLSEAKMINKSLSALGNVIKALTEGKAQHIPYRDSKLTRILQESLGGNARTTLVINCSPSSYNEEETLSTLRFGMRAKTIKNKAKANVDRSPAELKAMLAKAEAEIDQLKELIASLKSGNGSAGTGGSGAGDGAAGGAMLLEITEKLEAAQKQLEAAQDEKTQLLDAQESLRDSIAEKTMELERNAQLVAQLTEERDALVSENTELLAAAGEAEFSLKGVKSKLEEANVQVDSLRQENSRVKAELEELHQQHDLSALVRSESVTPTPRRDGSAVDEVVSPAPRKGPQAADWAMAEEDIRQTLQQGFERVKQMGTKLFGAEQPPSQQEVQGAIEEIRALGEQLVVNTPRLSITPPRKFSVESISASPGAPAMFGAAPSPPHPASEDPTVAAAAAAIKSEEDAAKEQLERMNDMAERALKMAHSMAAAAASAPVPVVPVPTVPAASGDSAAATGVAVEATAAGTEEGAVVPAASPVAVPEVVAVVASAATKSESPAAATGLSVAELEEKLRQMERDREDEMRYAAEEFARLKDEMEKKAKDQSDAAAALREEAAALRAQNEELRKNSGIAEQLQVELQAIKTSTEAKLAEIGKVREALLVDLENRCLRVVDLQMQLDEVYERYEDLRKSKVVSNERLLKKQILAQQRELQKAAREIRRLTSETQRLHSDDDVSKKQLTIRTEYVKQLEAEVKELQRALRENIVQSTTQAPVSRRLSLAIAPSAAVTRAAATAQANAAQQQQQQPQAPQPARLQLQDAILSSKISKPIRGGGLGVVVKASPAAAVTPSTASTSRTPSTTKGDGDTDDDGGDGSSDDDESKDEGEMTMEEFLRADSRP